MSSTSLVQRTSSAITKPISSALSTKNTVGQQSQQSTSSSALTTAGSLLPKLNFTPQKSSTSSQIAGTPPQQQQPSPTVSTPGQWQHPRMDEVIRRRNATTFDSNSIRVIGLNAVLLLASFFLPSLASSIAPRSTLQSLQPYTQPTLLLLRLALAINIALSLYPLFTPADPCEDIPLTASQRQLLGLPPMSRSATPQEQQAYVTPPRYSRSATPNSASSSTRAVASPLSARGSPALDSSLRRSLSGSPFNSPRPSPRWEGKSGGRRVSFNSSADDFDGVGGSGVITPTKSNKASVGLNSKWLYEKGRVGPRMSGGHAGSPGGGLAGFGGSGSVFA